MTATMLGSASIGAFDGVSLDMLIRQGFRPVPITRTQLVTPDVLLVELSPAEVTAPFTPGSHLEVAIPLPEGPAIRHYSLVSQVGAGARADVGAGARSDVGARVRPDAGSGVRSDVGSLQIAILREQDGRGGSAWLHEYLPSCASVLVRGPRDTFGYRGDGPAFFVAGGIGITPITAMVAAAAEAGVDWHLLYVGRRHESMAFADDLARTYGTENVTIHITEESGRPDVVGTVRQWAANASADATAKAEMASISASGATTSASTSKPETAVTVYTCGPVPLMHALDVGLADNPRITVISEDFDSAVTPAGSPALNSQPTATSAASERTTAAADTLSSAAGSDHENLAAVSPGTTTAAASDQPFVVELGDGSEVDVPAGCSIIDALSRAGIRTLSSCRKGTCGTCETVILDGEADHRDSVLSPAEHAAQETMMICVSRACGKRIALDL